MADESMQVAQAILEQLGGRRFLAMTGATHLMCLEQGLQFSLPRCKDGINKVRVILTPVDTYVVEFWHVRGSECRLIESVDDVYCDTLAEVFEDRTNLATSL